MLPEQEMVQPDIISKELGSSVFAKRIVYRKSLSSTNTLAKDLASRGVPEGTVVLAEEQTAGRGRMGRRWLSPSYANLLFSILLRPPLHPDQVFVLTMILALAAIEAIRAMTGLRAMIKWPNDLYLERKKLAGILTEFSVRGKEIEYVILGLGLNVNWDPEDEKEIPDGATSIFLETGVKVSRNDLLIRILGVFERYYGEVLSGKIDDFYRRWNESSVLMGRQVEIEFDERKIRGKALRIDRKGALIIMDNTGQEQRILSGDVSVKSRGIK